MATITWDAPPSNVLDAKLPAVPGGWMRTFYDGDAVEHGGVMAK